MHNLILFIKWNILQQLVFSLVIRNLLGGGGVNILRVNMYHYDNSARNWNLYDQLQDLKFIWRNFNKNVMTEMIERKNDCV